MKLFSVKPSLKEIIWGGKKLMELYPDSVSMANIAEAWVLSGHKDGHSVVRNGEYAGRTLEETIKSMGPECLGTKAEGLTEFPLLIKLIDAKDKLSVQVHPDNAYAREFENSNGKTEAWFVLDAEEDACIVYDFNRDITKEEFKDRIKNGSLSEVLNTVKVKRGDVIYLPSGTVHAIGSGILLAEVQQSSNLTYRVYDYDRIDKNGCKRELHIDKAVEVANTAKAEANFEPEGERSEICGGCKTLLKKSEYFTMELIEVESRTEEYATEESFTSFLVLEGSGAVGCGGEVMPVKRGDSIFIPACKDKIALAGRLKLLKTTL